ncbi:flavin-containing monooxygenase [Rhizobium sp. C4]|uniref:flavin-containing monooxygenase n=1 Tax=Rhizobium sp. C4 TaxID=1349800 RepID=UPI001E3DB370|nr:NAD(P)/FAD-dependent oxidoreductase [Rhizobium sp. C4]MCD2176049.1 NAD(P)/FAD-dependent oxidoreductase [Rhizobium sp. C4]
MSNKKPSLDVAVIGAGFAGLYMLHKLRAMGFRTRVFEAADDVGGTWYWNRYPGARCDVESMQYSYSFSEDLQQEWTWTERFATQPEILRYINHVADRFGLRSDIQFKTRIDAARFDEGGSFWRLTTGGGESIDASYCIMATGCLSNARIPDLRGLADFRGAIFHTGSWPHEGVDFAGKRVGVIGTGSSGIQVIPEMAKQAKHLYVFQRTPNFTVPARNAPLTQSEVANWKGNYAEHRRFAREATRSGTIYDFAKTSALLASEEERAHEYSARWKKGGANFMHAFNDLLTDERANDTAAEFVRERIREIVKDPTLAEALSPRDYPIFTKRICVDTDYYETFNRPNVSLINLRKTPIETIVENGARTAESLIELDAIIFATGFDAITGALDAIDISGREGKQLREKWRSGPRSYLGLMSAGFPNLFTVTGPGSPSVLSNVIVSIEQHVDWIADCLEHLRSRNLAFIEPTVSAEDRWVEHVNEVANSTLYPRAASWYMGANIPGKARVFMPYIGVDKYRQICRDVVSAGYDGFILAPNASSLQPSMTNPLQIETNFD